jgi:hemoglobin-like flavoprotein
MTPKQIEIVQASFSRVAPIAETAAGLFYARLFELDPGLKPLFKGDMKRQGMMLMSMIGTAVRGLSNTEALVPMVKNLGRRHVGYGVKESHYGTVGQALIETLEKGLGNDFNADMREAWLAAYSLLSTVMKAGAAEVEPVARAA